MKKRKKKKNKISLVRLLLMDPLISFYYGDLPLEEWPEWLLPNDEEE
jgi:hypothetical protein